MVFFSRLLLGEQVLNERLRTVEKTDPDFATAIRRLRSWTLFFAAVVLLTALLSSWAVITNFGQDTRLTKIERSPCQVDPNGKACIALGIEVAQQRPIYATCIPFRRVGYTCPAPGFKPHSDPIRQPQQNPSGG